MMRSFLSMNAHHTMKNILLVFTGGTIGSSAKNGTIKTSDQARYQLLELFQQSYPGHTGIRFKTLQPLNLLSENLQPIVWQQLITTIEAENLSKFDGIIITHGTDTLAFSATALGLYFNALSIPMLLVSSNYPLDNAKANGLNNFICAVEYIRQKKPSGVFVPYRNPGQNQQIHIATRLAASLQLSGDFISVKSQSYMTLEQGRFTQLMPDNYSHSTITPLKAAFSKRILLIRPYPGLDYTSINLNQVDAVLHDLYHSGTASVSTQFGDRFSLLAFNKICRQKKLTLYLAPALKQSDAYQTTQQLMAQGAEMIWNMSLESAYVKLMLAYGNFTDQQKISAFLQQDIALEHV